MSPVQGPVLLEQQGRLFHPTVLAPQCMRGWWWAYCVFVFLCLCWIVRLDFLYHVVNASQFLYYHHEINQGASTTTPDRIIAVMSNELYINDLLLSFVSRDTKLDRVISWIE